MMVGTRLVVVSMLYTVVTDPAMMVVCGTRVVMVITDIVVM